MGAWISPRADIAANGLDIATPMKIIANQEGWVVLAEYGNEDRGLQQGFQIRVDSLLP